MDTKDMEKEQSKVSAATTVAESPVPTITAEMIQQFLKQQEEAKKAADSAATLAAAQFAAQSTAAAQFAAQPSVAPTSAAQPAVTHEMMMQQILMQQMNSAAKSQQMMEEAEAERQRQAEVVAQKQKKLQEHYAGSITAIKKLAGSWMMLVIAIACTVSLACSIANFAFDFSPKLMSVLIGLVPVCVNLALTFGVWMFFMARNKPDHASFTFGVSSIKSAISFYKFVWILICVLVCIILIMFTFFSETLAGLIDQVNTVGTGVKQNDASKINVALNMVLLVAFISLDTVILYFFGRVKSCLEDAEMRVRGDYPPERTSYTGLVVLLCILGVISAIAAVGSAFLGEALGAFADLFKDGGNSDVMGAIELKKTTAILSSVATGITFIFGAIIVSKYNTTTKKIAEEKAKLEA